MKFTIFTVKKKKKKKNKSKKFERIKKNEIAGFNNALINTL